MRFELPLLLWLAPVIGLGLVGLAWWAQRKRIRLASAWSPAVAALAQRGARSSVPLIGAAALAAAIAIAGPRGGRMIRSDTARGLNVLIAVDVSRSMLAEDVEPNRLQHAIREARRLVQDLGADRVGVIAFAGQSYVLSPLTLDHPAVNLYLETLDPDLASAGGTNLEAVFRQGTQVLSGSLEGGDRAMVIFTDGEGHDSLGLAVGAARNLAKEGVRLILVAEGGVKPVRIPLRDAAGVLVDYKRDAEGEVVETTRRDDVLQSLSNAADGSLIPATLPDQAGAVREQLGALSRRPIRERRLADLMPLAWVAALVAALVLLVQTGTRRGTALAALGALTIAGSASGQRLPPGDRLVHAGKASEAIAAFRREALAGRGGDTAWFNAGTAALLAGRLDDAKDALDRAAGSLDPGLRYRALYNLGVVAIHSARKDSSVRAEREAEGLTRFKQALLLDPSAADAKWNMELLLRPAAPTSGGRKQGRSPPQPQQGPKQEQQQQPSSAGLSPREAEAILSAVEQSEAATRASAVRRQRLRATSTTRDW